MITSKRKYYILIAAAVLLVSGFAAYHYYFQEKNGEDKVFVHVKTFQTSLGWGYDIFTGDKLYIHQDFVPAISGRHGFKSREEALATGKKVIEKISAGSLPSLTVADLKELGVINDSAR